MTIDCKTINIKKRSSGETVKELQKYLTYYKYYDGNIDGNCGEYTVTAIKKYQKANDLKEDGIFGTLSCQKSNINGKDISSSTMDISNSTYNDMLKRYNDFVKTKAREPKTLYLNKEYPYEYITLERFGEMSKRFNEFIKANGREPKTLKINRDSSSTTTSTTVKTTGNTIATTTNTTSNKTVFTSGPHYENTGCNKLGQCTGYYCFPHSFHQCLRKFGIIKYTEKQLARWCGTTSSGTSHMGGNTGIAKVASLEGIKLKVKWVNFSDLGDTVTERYRTLGELMSDKNKGIIIHLAYRNKFGHYETNKTVNLNNKTVTVLNSLGSKCNSPAYCGYVEHRSFSNESSYIANTTGGQPSICIITKE